MAAALLLLKSFGAFALDSLKLLLDPKVWLLLAVAGAGCFVRGCQHEELQFDNYKAIVEKAGEQQVAFTRARNAENKAAQQEVDDENEMALDSVADELTATNRRLSDNARGSFVPGAGARPDQPLQPGQTEGVSGVVLACFDANELDERVRADVNRLQQRFAKLAESSVAALTSLPEWRTWAGKVGSCPVASPAAQ